MMLISLFFWTEASVTWSAYVNRWLAKGNQQTKSFAFAFPVLLASVRFLFCLGFAGQSNWRDLFTCLCKTCTTSVHMNSCMSSTHCFLQQMVDRMKQIFLFTRKWSAHNFERNMVQVRDLMSTMILLSHDMTNICVTCEQCGASVPSLPFFLFFPISFLLWIV